MTMAESAPGLLIDQHNDIGALLFDATSMTGREQRRLVAKASAQLRLHIAAEQHVMAALYRSLGADDMIVRRRLARQHDPLLEALGALGSHRPGTPPFTRNLNRLCGLVADHAEEHEKRMFPLLRKRFGPERLQRLAVEARQMTTSQATVDALLQQNRVLV